MEKTKIIEEVFQMRFEDIYGRFKKKRLSCQEAAEILGVSLSTFYRKRQRYEEKNFQYPFDRRIGRASPHKAADEEVEFLTNLYTSKYTSFNVKHFHTLIKKSHGFTRSYSWTKNTLAQKGLFQKGKQRGRYRKKRERKPMEGMMLHQDGSSHRWIPSLPTNVDLILTMDDATSKITSAFFVEEEGTFSSFKGVKDTIEAYGLFCSLYTDRGSHYFCTSEAGKKVNKGIFTQVGRALKQLRIHHIAAYSPEARGRCERAFRTLQGRLPQEMELFEIRTLEEANQYLKERFIPSYNEEFSVKAEDPKTAFIPWAGGDLDDILCVQEKRTVRKDNTVSYGGKELQIPQDSERFHYVKAEVMIHKYGDQSLALFYGPMCLGKYGKNGELLEASSSLQKRCLT